MNSALKVGSPLCGWCASLEDNPDAVFRGRVLGEGVSIDPTVGEVRAPFDGEVLSIPKSRHAVNLKADNGAECLIHIGVDTVKMEGRGFQALVAPGDRVILGQLLLKFDLEQVLRGALSLRTPVLLLQSDRFALSGVTADGPVNFGDPLFEVHATESRPAENAEEHEQGPGCSRSVVVGLEHGIHARPAAALIDAIGPYRAHVECRFGDRPPANAASAVALMALGVSYGDVVTISARGQDAAAAVEKAVAALEPLDSAPPGNPKDEGTRSAVERADSASPPADGTVIRAQSASPGLAMGMAFQLGIEEQYITAPPGTAMEEHRRLDEALKKVRVHLEQLTGVGSETGAGIARAHLALLTDPLIETPARQKIDGGDTAVDAWKWAVDEALALLGGTDNKRMRERMDDLRDINCRVRRALAGQDPWESFEIPADAIILADNLLPSHLMELDGDRLRGICLAAGGATSHVAILAISLGLPMLVAAGASVSAIRNGTPLIIDAELGELTVRPDPETAERFDQRRSRDLAQRAAERERALDECRTTDGVRIHVLANIGSARDALEAVKGGAEGCGLLRTEFVYMERHQAPSLNDQLAVYSQIADAFGDRPMVVRTLDAGGDKPVSYVKQQPEENPALGVRGIRLSLEEGRLLETQLQALLRLRRPIPLQVMIPMVSSVHEVLAVRDQLDALRSSTKEPGDIRLGVMIETPAAALIADQLAKLVDFFSIGTNDLTQYTLCMDRGEPRFASRLDPLHPAVLRLIKGTVDAARIAGIPVAVCGGAAGDFLAAPVLVGLGVRELSMPGRMIARQKRRLRALSTETCGYLATQALAMNSARNVRAMMRDFVLSGNLPSEGS